MSTFFLKRTSAVLAGLSLFLAPMSPLMAQEVEVTTTDIQSCRTAVLQEYQADLREATGAFRSTMLQQWERQVGFRVRAATAARKASVERALRAGGRRQEQVLGTAIQTFIRAGSSDTNQLPGLLNGDDPSPAFERWADRAMPSIDGLRRPLNAMEISLRLYANTRDRAVIRSVWQDAMRKALNQLKEEYSVARGTFANGYMACEVDPAGTSEAETETDTADGDETEADDTSGADSSVDSSVGSVGASAGSDRASADSRSVTRSQTPAGSRPAAGSSSSAGPTTNGRTVAPAPTVNRVRVFVVTEGVVPASLCTAAVLSRVEIEGTPGARVSGRFYFDDEAVSEVKTISLDSTGKGTAEFRRQMTAVAATRALSGRVRFIAEASNILESSRVAYSHECPAARDAASAGGANSSSSGEAAGSSTSHAAHQATISLDLDGSDKVRVCGAHTFRITGNVLVTNTSKFKYRWEFSDGVMSDERVGDASANGSRVQYDWTLGGVSSNWIRLRVLDPVSVVSEPISFVLEQECKSVSTAPPTDPSGATTTDDGAGSSAAGSASGADADHSSGSSSAAGGAGAAEASGSSRV